MAQKRMFDKKVVGSDKFIDLPNSSKALYFMAGMEADDKGFFQPRKLQRMCGFSDDDYKILIAKGFFITFESGVMVVTDWNKNNWLDNRRVTETEYIDELNMLKLINQKYELINGGKQENIPCLANAKPMLSQYSIEENSIDKNSIDNSSSSVKDILYDKNIEKLQEIMLETLGITNINNIKECISYLDMLPLELIEYALRKTARIERPSWQYTIPILDSYIQNGFTTLEQIKADELKHKSGNKEVVQEETEEEKMKRKIKELEDRYNANQ